MAALHRVENRCLHGPPESLRKLTTTSPARCLLCSSTASIPSSPHPIEPQSLPRHPQRSRLITFCVPHQWLLHYLELGCWLPGESQEHLLLQRSRPGSQGCKQRRGGRQGALLGPSFHAGSPKPRTSWLLLLRGFILP